MMTRRERFQAIMERKPVDRVLYDLAGTGQTQVDAPELTEAIKALLDIHGPYTGSYEKYDERILETLDIDTRRVGELFEPASPLIREKGGRRYDCWGVGRAFTGLYWEIVEHPLKGATMEDLESYPWPDASNVDPALFEKYRRQARHLYEDTDYVVVAEHPCYGVMEIGCWMMGFDEYLYKLAAEPELIEYFTQRVLRYQKDIIARYYEAVGPYIHLTTSGDDFGTQESSFISRRMFDEMIAPAMAERIRYTREFTDGYFFHHTCGSVFNLIPSLIEIGVDILNPIQPLARNMEAARLKESYGNQLTFWGGIDTQELLVKGTPQAVSAQVRRTIDDMKGTGYVLAPAHTLQKDVPAANVIAIYRPELLP